MHTGSFPSYLHLSAAISILVSQALTLQRSLKYPGVLDWVAIIILWLLVPVLISLLWFKFPRSNFTILGTTWCLSIGAASQALMLVIWPATIMPDNLFVWINDTVVTFSGAWIQSTIVCTALCLGIRTIAFDRDSKTPSNPSIHIIAVGTGLLISGAGLLLATYFGWTMYLLPSAIIWLLSAFLNIYKNWHVKALENDVEQKSLASMQKKPLYLDISARLGNWAGVLFAILPLLLLSFNFQRERYAPGYWFPLVLLGGVIAACAVSFLMLRIKTKKLSFTSSRVSLCNIIGLAIGGVVNVIIVGILVLFPSSDANFFFKSWGYLVMVLLASVSCMPAVATALDRLSDGRTYDPDAGLAFGRLFFAGLLLAIFVVIMLVEGTSMIYSWEFGDSEASIVTASVVALGWLFTGLSIISNIMHVYVNRKKGGV